MSHESSGQAAKFAVSLGVVWVAFALIWGIAITLMDSEGGTYISRSAGAPVRDAGHEASKNEEPEAVKTKVYIQGKDGSSDLNKEAQVETQVQIKQ